jgi:TonB family protein
MNRRTMAAMAGALALAGLPLTAAQNEPASLSGLVVDPLGSPVPNATLILASTRGQVTHEARADDGGRFSFPKLPAGDYRLDARSGAELPQVTLTLNGSAGVVRPLGMTLTIIGAPVTLRAGEALRREVVLQLGPVYVNASVRMESPDEPQVTRTVQFPDNWRCVGDLPLCGPPSLVEEFERDQQEAGRLPAGVQAPRQIGRVAAQYPASLKGSGITGSVRLDGRIGTDGFLTGLRVVSAAHPDLAQAALDGAAQARWEPARIRGTLVEVPAQLTFEFTVVVQR